MTLSHQPINKFQIDNCFAVLGLNVKPDQELFATSSTSILVNELMLGTADWSLAVRNKVPDEDFLEDLFSGTSGSSIKYVPFDIERTSSVNIDNDMVYLSMVAETGKEEIFVQALESIDWGIRSSEDYVHAIQLALSIGAHLSARQLISDGYQKYPNHKILRMIANILLPPKIEQVHRRADLSIGMNKDWFELHSLEYRGQWVALKNGYLLGSAQSFVELKQIVPNWREVTITKITW